MALTKSQKLNRSLSEELHARIDNEFAALRIPSDWHEVWRDEDRRPERRTRVTLALDSDVVRFFKAMGSGYQPRINRVLRAFMHDRLAGLVAGPEDRVAEADAEKLRLFAQEMEQMSRPDE